MRTSAGRRDWCERSPSEDVTGIVFERGRKKNTPAVQQHGRSNCVRHRPRCGHREVTDTFRGCSSCSLSSASPAALTPQETKALMAAKRILKRLNKDTATLDKTLYAHAQ